jgi:hypothetical protein
MSKNKQQRETRGSGKERATPTINFKDKLPRLLYKIIIHAPRYFGLQKYRILGTERTQRSF